MKELKQIAQENGFKLINVSAEEFEDGIGAAPGENFIKDGIWYTINDLVKKLNLPSLKVKPAKLALSLEKSRSAMMDWLKKEKVEWFYIYRLKKLSDGDVSVSAYYGK